MIPLGKTLREAREAKGLTIGQIAESTHMLSAMVQDLENEDFTRLPAPIYGRGFVKLYCEAVGLDPKPMIAEFMDLFNGVHEPTIRERAPSTPPAPPAPPEPAESEVPAPEPPMPEPEAAIVPEEEPKPPAPEPPQPVAAEPPHRLILQPGLFDAPASTPSAPQAAFEQTTPDLPPSAEPAPIRERSFARYASPLSERDRNIRPALVNPSIWRLAIIVAVLALVLWGVLVGFRALYRATAPELPTDETAVAEAPVAETPAAAPEKGPEAKPEGKPAATPEKKDVKPAGQRKPQDIPPLYLD